MKWEFRIRLEKRRCPARNELKMPAEFWNAKNTRNGKNEFALPTFFYSDSAWKSCILIFWRVTQRFAIPRIFASWFYFLQCIKTTKIADFKYFEKFGVMRFYIEKSYTPYLYWVYWFVWNFCFRRNFLAKCRFVLRAKFIFWFAREWFVFEFGLPR